MLARVVCIHKTSAIESGLVLGTIVLPPVDPKPEAVTDLHEEFLGGQSAPISTFSGSSQQEVVLVGRARTQPAKNIISGQRGVGP